MDLIKRDTRSVKQILWDEIFAISSKCHQTLTNLDSTCTASRYKEIPAEEERRVPFIQELIEARKTGPFDETTKEDLVEICDYVCES